MIIVMLRVHVIHVLNTLGVGMLHNNCHDHVMDICYARFEDPYGDRGVHNMLIPMLCNVMSAKHAC